MRLSSSGGRQKWVGPAWQTPLKIPKVWVTCSDLGNRNGIRDDLSCPNGSDKKMGFVQLLLTCEDSMSKPSAHIRRTVWEDYLRIISTWCLPHWWPVPILHPVGVIQHQIQQVRNPSGSKTDQLKAPGVPADRLFPQIRIKGANLDFPKTIITMYFLLPGITESYSILFVMQHTWKCSSQYLVTPCNLNLRGKRMVYIQQSHCSAAEESREYGKAGKETLTHTMKLYAGKFLAS